MKITCDAVMLEICFESLIPVTSGGFQTSGEFLTHLWSVVFVVQSKSRARVHRSLKSWLDIEVS